jgi:hypothetical protein
MLQLDSSDFLVMTKRPTSLPDDDAVSEACHSEYISFSLFRGSCMRLKFDAMNSSVSNLFCLSQPETGWAVLRFVVVFPVTLSI